MIAQFAGESSCIRAIGRHRSRAKESTRCLASKGCGTNLRTQCRRHCTTVGISGKFAFAGLSPNRPRAVIFEQSGPTISRQPSCAAMPGIPLPRLSVQQSGFCLDRYRTRLAWMSQIKTSTVVGGEGAAAQTCIAGSQGYKITFEALFLLRQYVCGSRP